MKKVSKVLSFAVGVAFILVQSLSFAGYIDVNYGRIEDDVKVALTTDLFAAVAINATQYAIYSFIGRLFLM